MLGTSSGKPWRNGAGGGLLGHAVMTDDGVKAAAAVGVLGSVVGLQWGRDAALVLMEDIGICNIRAMNFNYKFVVSIWALQLFQDYHLNASMWQMCITHFAIILSEISVPII